VQAGSRTPPLSAKRRVRALAPALLLALTAQLLGCASVPPGSHFEKQSSVAYAHPQDTRIAKLFAPGAATHPGDSALRIFSKGTDGFALRMQLIAGAEHALDLQYFIYHQDQTGRLITEALLRAADRGVHVRLLVDDGGMEPGDERIRLLAAHPQIEVRIFNPFTYRGGSDFPRAIEFAFHRGRLDFRMHNKLLLADNASALIGGRNIGDQYFQIDPQGQFADDDVFVSGPAVPQLSGKFDSFWNSPLAIPVEALAGGRPTEAQLAAFRAELSTAHQALKDAGTDYLQDADSGEPLAGILDGELPVVWAPAQVVGDAPDKQHHHGDMSRGPFIYAPLAATVSAVQSELLMITPYFVPTSAETQLLLGLRQRNVHIGILTNSLESAPEVSAHAGYERHRLEMLQAGVEFHEVRAAPTNARGSGQSAALSRHGNYGLHAKLYAFDRRKLFIGSMNFDERSARLNTEIGLIIDSGELTLETVSRYQAMTQPGSAYEVALEPDSAGRPHLVWRTQVGGRMVSTTREPARNPWQRIEKDFLVLIPIDREL
jgi:cardiolipin synthase C